MSRYRPVCRWLRNLPALSLILPVLLLIAPAAVAQQASQSAEVTVRSRVVSAATGHAIEGALIELSDGSSTWSADSDDNGRFRLVGVPAAAYTLTVHAIGFRPLQRPVELTADTALPELELVNARIAGATPAVGEEIIVYGTRSAQAAALNKQRAAVNISNVISADQAGNFPDDTAAGALRRVPGISFQRQERSGEGEFISIRGLDAGLNNVQINGVGSAQSEPGSRRVPFSVFQADSIAEIVVNKTLLPDQSGVGIGGSVELHTATPLQQGRNILRVSLSGRDNDFTDKTGHRFGITGSRIFADGRFGVLASFTTRKRYRKVYQFDVLGDWMPVMLPLDANGDPIEDFSDLPVDSAFEETREFAVEDIRYNVFEDERDNYSATLALEWRATDATTLALIYNDNKEEVTNERQNAAFEQSDDFSDVDVNNAQISPEGNFFFHGSSPFLHVNLETEDSNVRNRTLSLQAETFLDRWEFQYGAGYAAAESHIPLSKELNFEIQDIDELGYVPAGVGPTGLSYIDFAFSGDNYIPVPLLTPAGYQAITDPSQYVFEDADVDTRSYEDERLSAYFDATLIIDRPLLRSIKVGVKYETSDRLEQDIEWWDDDGVGPDGTVGGDDDFTLADTNLLTGSLISYARINTPAPQIPAIMESSRAGVQAFGRTVRAGVDLAELDPSDNEIRKYQEDIGAAYAMANLSWDDWTLVGGVRVEHQSLDTNVAGFTELNFIDDTRDVNVVGERLQLSATHTQVLPRFQLNYRASEKLVFRSAIWTALARPQYAALGSPRIVEFNEEDLTLAISEGNPDLEAAYATSFDFGVEYYSGRIGIMALNLFYKRIENFAYDDEFSAFGRDGSGFDLDSIPGLEDVDPTTLDISISRPRNGQTAYVRGIELTFVRQFPELPGFWSGFGVYANATLQETEAELEIAPNYVRHVPFFNSPDYTGTLAITYEQYGVDTTLSYSFQAEQLDSVEFYQIDEYEQPYESLDLTMRYTLPLDPERLPRTTVFLKVADLTDQGSNKPINWETRGHLPVHLDDVEFDGRTIRFGITTEF